MRRYEYIATTRNELLVDRRLTKSRTLSARRNKTLAALALWPAGRILQYCTVHMPPPVVPVEDGGGGAGENAAAAAAARHSCHFAWLAWWADFRCFLASAFLPCHAALCLPAPPAYAAAAVTTVVRGTLFVPSTGDRRVRLFLHDHAAGEELLVLDLPAGLGGADIAASGRLVLECRREWGGAAGAGKGGAAGAGGADLLLGSPKWLVYCNGSRVGFAARREKASDAEGWLLQKLAAVTAGAGRLPGGGVEYLRGRFERVVASPDAESFHLVEPIAGRLGVAANGDGGLSIFFHRI